MVGNRIKNYLSENGIKQKYVAEKLGVPFSTFNSMLLERQKLPTELYIEICSVLGVPLDLFAS